MSKIYVVATPIGNLQDITFRAIETLKKVDVILCEDTRVTQKLLNHFEIKKPTISFHKFSEQNKYQKIFDLLKDNQDLALVSDAGTPAISDPGSFLIREIRQQMPEVEIVPIAGASALSSALSVAGLEDRFVFLGFPPHKKGRKTFFEEALKFDMPVIFYESKHRLIKTLESLAELVPDRQIFIAKEMTKLNENFFENNALELLKIFARDINLLKGEFVIILK